MSQIYTGLDRIHLTEVRDSSHAEFQRLEGHLILSWCIGVSVWWLGVFRASGCNIMATDYSLKRKWTTSTIFCFKSLNWRTGSSKKEKPNNCFCGKISFYFIKLYLLNAIDQYFFIVFWNIKTWMICTIIKDFKIHSFFF